MQFYSIAIIGSPIEPLTYHFDSDLKKGDEVVASLNGKEWDGVVLELVSKPDFKTQAILKTSQSYYSNFQIQIAEFIAEYYGSSVGEALNLFTPYSSQVSAKVSEAHKIKITLSPSQEAALSFLRLHPVALLFGDTGSGKSEIYMKRMEEVLNQGKRVLLLLPEISLTPQMEQRFKNHFGDAVVLWHSKMTPTQKKRSLEKIHSGEAQIIAGPRSALFLPINDLGLIVVDEEHDESYKSSSRPRYNARDLAIYIGSLMKIPLILGSATPSLTSYAKFPFYRLRGGYYETKRRFEFESSVESLSPAIDRAVQENYSKGNQGIVFLPTRANFKYLICNDCGYSVECPFCSVGMSLHRNSRALKCHYCNYTEIIPKICPKCQSPHLDSSRMGTAEAVEHFQTLDESLRVLQFDRDVITTQNKLIKALESFNNREIDLLVGTQMLSKGHNYHDIALAVIMGIDNLLSQSDYRSKEKALSLLIQIAGRSGRRDDATVLVQSFNRHFFEPYLEDYEQFLKDELKLREGRYPPYVKLARLLYAHKNGDKAKAEMEKAVELLSRLSLIEIVGYGAAPIEKIAGKYRFVILLRSSKSTDLIRSIKAVKGPLCEIDMDPIEFV